jgi:hypothetical protein
MKKILAFLSVIVLCTIGCNREKPNPIEGAWDLVYAVNIVNDTVSGEFPGTWEGKDMKMWSKEHFIFIGLFRQDTTEMDNFGGGTYTLNDNIYNETIEYHVNKEAVGNTNQMYVKVSNDTLYQIWPVDDTGVFDKANYNEERYIKIK